MIVTWKKGKVVNEVVMYFPCGTKAMPLPMMRGERQVSTVQLTNENREREEEVLMNI